MQGDNLRPLTLETILEMDSMDLARTIFEQYAIEVPPYIETVDQMNVAQSIISSSISNYAYLDNMAQMWKIKKREMKRNKEDKQVIDETLSKEELFVAAAEHCKMAYQATSRLITLRSLILEELHMSDSY